MNVSKAIQMICVTFLIIPLAGCWDSLDIDNRAMVLSLAIDKAEKNEIESDKITHLDMSEPKEPMIKITVQIAIKGRISLSPLSSKGGGEEEKPVWVVSAVGHTIDDALLQLQQEIAYDLFLGHLRIIMINENIAKEGVERLNDFLHRESEVRRTVWMVVTKEKASDYMHLTPKLERIPALYLINMVEHLVDLGRFPPDFIGKFWSILASKGQDGYLPYLELRDDNKILMDGLAYFKEDKMIGKIDPIEIGIFMGIIGESEGGYSGFINIPNGEEKVILEGTKRVRNIKTEIKNGKPVVNIEILYEGDIDEKDASKIDLDDPRMIVEIENQASIQVIKSIEKLIQKLQEDESDIFGFGEHIRAKHPVYWNREVKTKEKWRTIYKELDVNVKVHWFIRRVGMKEK